MIRKALPTRGEMVTKARKRQTRLLSERTHLEAKRDEIEARLVGVTLGAGLFSSAFDMLAVKKRLRKVEAELADLAAFLDQEKGR